MAVNQQSHGCIVFGAGGGIGSETARRLAASGARLLLAGRTAAKLAPLAAELGAEFIECDVRQSAAVESVFEQAGKAIGPITGAVNCVGSILLKPAHLTSDAEWADTLATNLNSAFCIVRAAAQAMTAAGGGSVVLVSSVAARRGLANHEAIAAAKAGIIGLTLSAAATYACQRIRFNAVAPGLVQTPLTQSITGNEAALKFSTNLHPLGRIGQPGDIASAICWLLDPAQSWITGQVISVDGGLSTVQAR
jgi:NAD(P)-dependent dehydrogenase (short-subunit alcohol dehydrogenase family)